MITENVETLAGMTCPTVRCLLSTSQTIYSPANLIRIICSELSTGEPESNSLSIVTEPTGWTIRVRFSAGARIFPPRHRVQIGSGAHPVPYPMCIGVLSPEDKAAWA